ncbi:Vacuolar protease A [Blyttiomyces sp. JEL0837]|nr:Vacuolar protease A [Blyttiomyces sp. JEL0837]
MTLIQLSKVQGLALPPIHIPLSTNVLSYAQHLFGYPGKEPLGNAVVLVAYQAPVTVGSNQSFSLAISLSTPISFIQGQGCTYMSDNPCSGNELDTLDSNITILSNNPSDTPMTVNTYNNTFNGNQVSSPFAVDEIQVSNLTYIAATSITNLPSESIGDGILSLSYMKRDDDETCQDGNTIACDASWFLNLDPFPGVFGLYLPYTQDFEDKGELSIGGTSRTGKFLGSFTYFNLSGPGSWKLSVKTIGVSINDGDNSSTTTNTSPSFIELDTIYNFIDLETESFQLVVDAVDAQFNSGLNQYLVNCGTADQSPNVVIELDSNPFVITPASYIHKDRTARVCILLFNDAGQGSRMTFGSPFLREYYSSYLWKSQLVGFAKAFHSVS